MHTQETVCAHFEKRLSSPCYLVFKDSFSHSKKHSVKTPWKKKIKKMFFESEDRPVQEQFYQK